MSKAFMSAKRHTFLRLLISGGVLGVLLYFGDVQQFTGVWGKIRWDLLAPFFLMIAIFLFLFGLRWWLMLEGALTIRQAMAATVIGLGANMVLPARGGDLLRAYQSHHHTEASAHLVLARLFLEKILDLGTVLLVGGGALLILGVHEGHGSVALVAFGFIVTLLIVLVLLRLHSDTLSKLTRAIFSAVRLGFVFDRYLDRLFHELASAIGGRRLLVPFLLSLIIWLTVHASAYMICTAMVGVPLSYVETLVLLLAGAIGLAIPAAPSGLGTFHAAIASGFVLIGKPVSEGLLAATAIHACTFVGLLAPATVVYIFSGIRKSNVDPVRARNRS